MNLSISKLLDLLYPGRCALCDCLLKKNEPYICRDCAPLIRFRNERTCVKCGRPLAGRAGEKNGNENEPEAEICDECSGRAYPFAECVAPFAYSGAIRDSILRFKYHDRPEYARFYAACMFHYAAGKIRLWRPDALIPVPVHRSREIQRGYNQAFLIAKELSKRTGIPLMDGIVKRRRRTEAQKELGFEERKSNISGAFVYTGAGRPPGSVLVVDDIFTTGSTLAALSELLIIRGANRVYGICVSS